MSTRSKAIEDPKAKAIREAADRERKKWLMIFGHDQTPDQIVAAITEAHRNAK